MGLFLWEYFKKLILNNNKLINKNCSFVNCKYNAMKAAMERAASRGKYDTPGKLK